MRGLSHTAERPQEQSVAACFALPNRLGLL
jgi:hypothetical protein